VRNSALGHGPAPDVLRSKAKRFEVVFDKDGKVTEEEDKSKAREKDGD
jgi:hypothetical protein